VLQGKVGEWEQVAVPAGTFHALRVDVTIRGIGRLGWNNTTYITYWYSPECNRFVKLHLGDENQGIIEAEFPTNPRGGDGTIGDVQDDVHW
jgi:hypothetical protein